MTAASNFNLKTQTYQVEDLSAGADIFDRGVFFFPQRGSFQGAYIFASAASTGIDASNTLVVSIKSGSTTLATLTRTSNIAANTQYNLTNANGHNASQPAGTMLTADVVQGATANMPAFTLVIIWNTDGLVS